MAQIWVRELRGRRAAGVGAGGRAASGCLAIARARWSGHEVDCAVSSANGRGGPQRVHADACCALRAPHRHPAGWLLPLTKEYMYCGLLLLLVW